MFELRSGTDWHYDSPPILVQHGNEAPMVPGICNSRSDNGEENTQRPARPVMRRIFDSRNPAPLPPIARVSKNVSSEACSRDTSSQRMADDSSAGSSDAQDLTTRVGSLNIHTPLDHTSASSQHFTPHITGHDTLSKMPIGDQQGPYSLWSSAVTRPQRCMTELIRSCPQELRDEILAYTLAASMPIKQYLSRNEQFQDVCASDTQGMPPSSVLTSNLEVNYFPGALRRFVADLQNGISAACREQIILRQDGASRLLSNSSNEPLEQRLFREKSVVTLDGLYEVPLALQVNRESRAFWAQVHYEETIFWVSDNWTGVYERWIGSLSGEVRDVIEVLVRRSR